MNNFKNKKVAILGFGVEGKSTASFLLKNDAKVEIFDEKAENELDSKRIYELQEKGIKFHFGKFPENFSDFDVIVRSPGINPNKLNGVKAPITSATKIFFDLCPAKIIGVTGTKGKGTTSSLIYEMLKTQGVDAYLGGNIGTPPLDFLEKLNSDSKVVLELSSFQLEDLGKSLHFTSSVVEAMDDKEAMVGKPHIAVVLMMTSEHLDYHKDVTEYIEAKRNILRFQTAFDVAIINKDYPASRESDIYTEAKVYNISREDGVEEGCCVENGEIKVKLENRELKVIDTKDILLPGRHNLENVCAAVMAASTMGVSNKNIVSVLKTFKGLEHRLELVRTVNGVRYYDDSFSTTPETAMAAIEAFYPPAGGPEILILGGSSKNSDFSHLGEVISKAENIKAIIGIGEEWKRIKEAIENYSSSGAQRSREVHNSNSSRQARTIKFIENCKNMQEIVRAASEMAEFGDVVLLSPACASFDMFKDYKDRGEQFKFEVNRL